MMIKKLIIARRNAGLGDNLMNAANSWLYAKKTNRALLIGWYKSIYIKSAWTNAFYQFFTIQKTLDGVPIIRKGLIYFVLARVYAQIAEKLGTLILGSEQRYKLKNHKRLIETISLKRKNKKWITNVDTCLGPDVVSSDQLAPFFRSLNLRKDLAENVNKYSDQNFSDVKVIGLHIRYYPAHLEHSNYTRNWLNEAQEIEQIEKKLKDCVSKLRENYIVFLCTDSPKIQKIFKKKIGNKLIHYFDINHQERDDQKELHTSGISIQTTENSLIEMFLLAKCDVLIRNTKSWFNFYAKHYVGEIIDVH